MSANLFRPHFFQIGVRFKIRTLNYVCLFRPIFFFGTDMFICHLDK